MPSASLRCSFFWGRVKACRAADSPSTAPSPGIRSTMSAGRQPPRPGTQPSAGPGPGLRAAPFSSPVARQFLQSWFWLLWPPLLTSTTAEPVQSGPQRQGQGSEKEGCKRQDPVFKKTSLLYMLASIACIPSPIPCSAKNSEKQSST